MVSRIIRYGDLDDVRRTFLETISQVRLQSAKVAALWDAFLNTGALFERLSDVAATPYTFFEVADLRDIALMTLKAFLVREIRALVLP